MNAPAVATSRYYDMQGHLLWEEPMRFSRLDSVGDYLIHEGVEYSVRRAAVAQGVQHVNLARLAKRSLKITDQPMFRAGNGECDPLNGMVCRRF